MPFDGDINDYSTSSNNGIDYTSGTYINGKWGQAKVFNGSSDYIKLTNTLDNSTGVSLSFGVNTYGALDTENNGAIISKYNMSGDLQSFIINSFGVTSNRTDNRIYAKYAGPSTIFDFCQIIP
jgi:hypothetical protein